MKLIQILVVDDEIDAIEGLIHLIKSVIGKNVNFNTAKSVAEANEVFKTKPVDLIFLDIHLGKENGFHFLEGMPLTARPPVIFVTAYDNYAIKALNSAALYYLMKPVNKTELTAAINKYFQQQHYSIRQEQLQVLLENFLQPTNQLNRVALPVGDNLEMIPKNQIIRCESASNYTHIYSLDGTKYTLAKTLKEVEEYMPSVFFRVHRSHLVNLNMIKKVNKKEAIITLIDSTLIPISDERKSAFLDAVRLTQ